VRTPDALVGRLSLELPLMGLLYLLMPLLWVGSLSLGDNPLRLWMLALPVAFGATLLGIVQRQHFAPARGISNVGMAAVAAGAVLVGAFPALIRAPAEVLIFAAFAAAGVLRHALRPPHSGERRFEVPALRTALPFYLTYLAACALAPFTEPGSALGLSAAADSVALRPIEILRLLNAAAAFTLLGYMVAELRARDEQPFGASVRRILAWSAPIALATRMAGDLAVGQAASWAPEAGVLWVALTVGAALYGGWLYHLQRGHVRALIERYGRSPRSSAHHQ
jgi:hypothetical protein